MFRADDIPLSLYIHLPWCDKKCPYCDFNSHLLRDQHQFEDYTRALISQLRGWSELFKSRKIKITTKKLVNKKCPPKKQVQKKVKKPGQTKTGQ